MAKEKGYGCISKVILLSCENQELIETERLNTFPPGSDFPSYTTFSSHFQNYSCNRWIFFKKISNVKIWSLYPDCCFITNINFISLMSATSEEVFLLAFLCELPEANF